MKRPRRNGITVMVLMLMLIFGITLVDTKSRRVSLTPIRLKQIMQNYVIIWHAWPASRVVSLVVHRHSAVPSVYSPSVTTADNFTNNISQIIPLMLWTSLAHYFSHSGRKRDRNQDWLSVSFKEIKYLLLRLHLVAFADFFFPRHYYLLTPS